MSESVNEYRQKIKKLKYKIEKEQNNYTQLKQSLEQYKVLAKSKLSIERVMKKINFLLQLKGMSITDWINSYGYQQGNSQQINLSSLVQNLQKMNIKLDAAEKSVLMSECSSGMADSTTGQQILSCARYCGVRSSS